MMSFRGLQTRMRWFLVNHVYAGTKHFEKKRRILQKMGHEIGEGTRIVGPVFCTGQMVIGRDCWIGKNIAVNGNGKVIIGDRCDIAPEVTFQTGSHTIGSGLRRAGNGFNRDISVGNGCWIGVRSTILGGVAVSDGCVIAACACVCGNIERNVLAGGVPAKTIRKLDHD